MTTTASATTTTTTEGQETLSPTLRTVAKRLAFWVALVVAAMAITLIGGGIARTAQVAKALEADSALPMGAKAVVEVLRDQGVTVEITDNLDDTEDALSSGDATLFFYDRDGLLTARQTERAVAAASTLVVLSPTQTVLGDLDPRIAFAGHFDGALDDDCSITAAERAKKIDVEGRLFRIVDLDEKAPATVTTGCFENDDDAFAVVRVERENGDTATVLGTESVFANETIVNEGNAALALNLLGENDSLVWYIPSSEDIDAATAPSMATLSPPWVVPVTSMLLLGGFAAALWRGRRLGPLIVENLPVVVRASETMQGRSRLYQSSSARLHALDSLRIGTIARLATACGLPRTANVDDVIATVAAVVGSDIHVIRNVLIDAEPHTDAQLVAYSDDLLELERHVARKVSPR